MGIPVSRAAVVGRSHQASTNRDRREAAALRRLEARSRNRALVLVLMIVLARTGAAQTVIPLINEPQTGQLGIALKLGTNPNAYTYLLDTGSAGFFSAKGVTSAWDGLISGSVSSSTFDISYGSGVLSYTGNVANTDITFTDANGAPFIVPNVRMGIITNEPYPGWNDKINNVVNGVATPIAPESPTSHLFFGTLGAGLYRISAANGSIGSVLGQIPVANGLTRGFIIHTGGNDSKSPTLTVGLTQTAIDLFPILIRMNPSTGMVTNDNGTEVMLYPEAQATATYVIANEADTYTTRANFVLDTGGQSTNITTGTLVDPPASLLSADGSQIRNGASFRTLAPGTPAPNSSTAAQGLDWQINPVGSTSYVDRVSVYTGTHSGIVNSGIDLFYRYDVLFDTDHGIIGFKPLAAAGKTANYQGLWWNPGESGWGISFAHQGDIVFAIWFTYDAHGSPRWRVAELHQSAEGLYSGPVYAVTGPPFTAVPFAPAPVETVVGTMTVAFADAAHGTLAYTVDGMSQTRTVVPQVFGPAPTCVWGALTDLALATNYTDLWWNASESGWGISLAHQGDIVFATWFTYDVDGTPLWLSGTAAKIGPQVYGGILYKASGPAFDAGPFDPTKVQLAPVGDLRLTFADGNDATFAYSVNGVSQSKAITRQVFRAPGTVCQ